MGSQDKEVLDEVDKNDIVIGTMTRKESKSYGKRHRIARIVVKDEDGNVLVQKRTPNKDTYPNCWDNSAAGHVNSGEEYRDAAVRELAEEIGLEGVPLREVLYYYSEVVSPVGQTLNRFTKLYEVVVPNSTKFTCQKTEVSQVRWMTIQEIHQLVIDGRSVTDGLLQVYERYLSMDKDENH